MIGRATLAVCAVTVFAAVLLPLAGIGTGTFGSNGGASINCVTSTGSGVGPTGTAPTNDNFFQAVVTDAKGNNRVILGMLEGSELESGQSNEIVAGAYGYFQIQDPGVVNPGVTIADALNPAWSADYMYPRYLNALNTVDPALWTSNPEAAGEQDAFAAEHPTVNYYVGQSPANVAAAFNIAIQEMQAIHLSTNFGGGTVTTAVGGSTCNANLPTNASGARLIVLKAAASQLGDPYVWGGTTPKSAGFPGAFDCSGLVIWSFQHAGINLPRVSSDQWFFTNSHTVTTTFADIDKTAVPGDLIFFAGGDGTLTNPGHVAIYWGHGLMIAAPQTGENVQIQPIPSTIGFVGVTDPYYLLPTGHPIGK